MKLGLGLGLTHIRTPTGGGEEPGEYIASAVNLSGGGDFLSIASLAATDNGLCSFSMWVKVAGYDETNGYTMFIVDPDVEYTNANTITGLGVFRAEFDSSGFAESIVAPSSGAIGTGAWKHILGTVKTDLGAGSKLLKLYINDADVTGAIVDGDASFSMTYNGLPFVVFSDTFGSDFVGDVADMWIGIGQSLLTGSDISEATRRKFIDASGKPVDLGADGSTPTGVAPAVFFSGNASSFATNKGTGGAFTLTGSLTNASTSPSD